MSPAKPSDQSPSAPAPAAKAKTSPVGRIVIGILLVVVAVEAVPYVRLTLAHARLSAELNKAKNEDHKFTADIVKSILGRSPEMTKTKRAPVGDELYEIYYFNGMLKRRELCLHYGVKGKDDPEGKLREVLEVTTVLPEELLIDDEPAGNPKFATPAVKPDPQPVTQDAPKEAATGDPAQSEQPQTAPASESEPPDAQKSEEGVSDSPPASAQPDK